MLFSGDNCNNGIYYSDCTNLGTIDNLSVINNTGDYGAFRINNCGDFTLGTGNTISGNSWPLSIDCGSFPDISSSIPTTGNTNNNIQVISGTGDKTGTWQKFSGLDYIVTDSPQLNGELTIVAGNSFKFRNGIYFNIYGTLHVSGTSGNEIFFTSETSGDQWQGLRFQNGSTGTFSYATVEYATYSTSYGIYANAVDSLYMEHCLLQNNDYGFYGINCDPEFTSNNEIINNLNYGIYLSGDCTPVFGSNLSQWNDIYGNPTYDFYNGTNDIFAEYIYWGTEVYSEIENQIYDQNDNASLGSMDFTPYTNAAHDTEFTGEIGIPANLTISVSADSVHLSWDVVNGATSYKIYSNSDPYEPVENWTFEAEVTEENWSEAIPVDTKKFYYVTAVK